MNSPAFLLALAPAATVVASRSVEVARSTGESFVSMLGKLLDAPSQATAAPTESKPTVAETVQSLAEQLRIWLSEHGAVGDYSIDYHQSIDGESQLNVDGQAAEKVKQLLASDSGWMAKLRQLASSMQAKSAQLNRDFVPPSVTIAIDPHAAKAY